MYDISYNNLRSMATLRNFVFLYDEKNVLRIYNRKVCREWADKLHSWSWLRKISQAPPYKSANEVKKALSDLPTASLSL
jgi:hypothetical protein